MSQPPDLSQEPFEDAQNQGQPEPPRVATRPLARILRARDTGEDPELIERSNLIRRHDAIRDGLRKRAEGRLVILVLFFMVVYGTIGVKMAQLAMSEPAEPRVALFESTITSERADITDRNDRILATNLQTQALYAQPRDMVDIAAAVAGLAAIFPDLDAEALQARLSRPGAKFTWIRQKMTPEEVQAVHEIGEPGLLFADREMRLYPNGPLAAHVLGGASFGEKGVRATEVIGIAGVEKSLDARLRDPARVGEPVVLSIDLPVQAAVETVLERSIEIFDAKGGSVVVMDANNGEIRALASFPDFDPNWRPRPLLAGDPAESPLFNRAVQGVYELGSVYKIFATAQAMELGLVNANTMIDTTGPMWVGRHDIKDFRDYGPELSVTDVIVKSSNIGTARIIENVGGERQRAFLETLGFMEPTPLEVVEARTGRPLLPKNWGTIEMMTISYGHGMSTSPVHLATGYASLLNGGYRVTPTLLKQGGPKLGPRVVSEQVSAASRKMLRKVVSDKEKGTATMADVPGYSVGGKTGTADKPSRGSYDRSRVIATFAAVFPSDDPEFVVVVTLDEAEYVMNGRASRTAGVTAVPVTRAIIERIAPLMGMRPVIAEPPNPGVREAQFRE